MLIKNYLNNFIRQSIKKNDHANIILSGGSSPVTLYKYIAKQNLNWKKIRFSLLDERLVNNKSKFLNFNTISKILKQSHKKINLINLFKYYKRKNLNSLIKDYSRNKPIIIAGFGDDGHFASIYQNSKFFLKLISKNEKKNILKVEKNGKPFVERLTMNFSLINSSKNIIIVLNNKKKLNLFKNFLKNDKKNTTIKHLVRIVGKKILIYRNKKLIKFNNFKLVHKL